VSDDIGHRGSYGMPRPNPPAVRAYRVAQSVQHRRRGRTGVVDHEHQIRTEHVVRTRVRRQFRQKVADRLQRHHRGRFTRQT